MTYPKSLFSWKIRGFHEFPCILCKFVKNSLRFRHHFHVFAPARPPRPDAYKRNGISSFFEVPRRHRGHFPQFLRLLSILQENAKISFSVNFIKIFDSCFFCENTCMSKTPIIPNEYQGYGAPGITKFNNFHGFHEFHEIS